jgi:hypothetical protein
MKENIQDILSLASPPEHQSAMINVFVGVLGIPSNRKKQVSTPFMNMLNRNIILTATY